LIEDTTVNLNSCKDQNFTKEELESEMREAVK
jgi:uncharacterized membrane protein YcaP (DUF421 family)